LSWITPPQVKGKERGGPPSQVKACADEINAWLPGLVVDLRITQVVNGVRGVHAVLPHDAMEKVAAGRSMNPHFIQPA
jgi:hypothetical protein